MQTISLVCSGNISTELAIKFVTFELEWNARIVGKDGESDAWDGFHQTAAVEAADDDKDDNDATALMCWEHLSESDVVANMMDVGWVVLCCSDDKGVGFSNCKLFRQELENHIHWSHHE